MHEGYEGLGVIDVCWLLRPWEKRALDVWKMEASEALVNENFGGLEKGAMEDMNNKGS